MKEKLSLAKVFERNAGRMAYFPGEWWDASETLEENIIRHLYFDFEVIADVVTDFSYELRELFALRFQ